MTENEAFGIVLRLLRTTKSLSQDELAFQAGLHRNYISLLELGRKSITLSTLFKLAAALDVDASAMVVNTELTMRATRA